MLTDLRGAMRRFFIGRIEALRAAGKETSLRKTRTAGNASGIPAGLARTRSLDHFLPKPTPANLRRFAETPVARKAINTIKDRIAGMKWRVQPRRGRSLATLPDGEARVQILTEMFETPNPDDSFRSLAEQVLEDVIVGGFGAIEIDRVEDWRGLDAAGQAAPLMLWPVDGA